MKFMNLARGMALAMAASLALAAAPAIAADGPTSYDAKDGNGIHQSFAAWLVGTFLHPMHLFEGLHSGAPQPVVMTNSGALDMTCVAGCSTTTDFRPASSTITAADAATTTATGQGSVSLVSGTPTANSFQTQAINGESSATVTTTGTFVATLQVEASYNGGVTYAPVSGLLRGTNLTTASITAPSVISLDVTGATHLRVRATSYTSGTATVQMAFSAAAGMTKILNGVGLIDRTTGANIDLSLAGSGIGADAAAPPANHVSIGVNQSGVLKGVISCDQHALYDASDNGSKTLVAGVAGKLIYVCGYDLATGGTATNLSLSSGTGTDCVTTSVNITEAYQLLANDRAGANSAFWNGLKTLATGDNLCIKASAANAHQGGVWYTVQ